MSEAFPETPDTATLRGIVDYAKLWLAEDENAPAVELVVGCQYVAIQLEKARDDAASTVDVDESLALPVRQSVEAHESLHDIVLTLAEYVDKNNRSAVRRNLPKLEEAITLLREAKEALGGWSRQISLRCPRCRKSQGDPCPVCGLELLYLEPEGESSRTMSSFPKEFSQVFQVYSKVIRGDLSLSAVFSSLEPLKRNLRSFQALVSSSLDGSPDSNVLKELEECLQSIFEGVSAMESTAQTRRMIDLRRGWYQVFESGIKFKDLRQRFLEEFGGEEALFLEEK